MTGYNTTQNRKIMIRAIIGALALLAVFCGMAAAEQFYVDEGGWWRVDGAGDSIYVWNGSYTENVDVDTAHLTLEGESADVVTVTAADTGDHVFEVTADWVNISGFAVRGATDYGMMGIHLDYVDYCDISGNNVYGNYYGIDLRSSSNNTLTNNTASNNYYGIILTSSSNNTLTNNTANSNYYSLKSAGIYLGSSSNNTLTNNTASNNNHGIYLRSSSNNMLANNIVNSNNYRGIYLDSSSNNTLTNNTANSNNLDGIYLDSSSNNDITCNWVQKNTQHGFYISGGRTGNTIEHNNIVENGNYNTTTGGWEWQFYMGQYQPVEAKHNYWGAGMNNSTIDASIYDDEEGWGEVHFYPFETESVQCPLTPETPAFTTADAVIALQIAAGSRPPDLRWDVSGDGSVTSLDALMILQAAAGDIIL